MEHKCEALPSNGIGVFSAEHFLRGEGWSWCLVVERLATEADLEENHYLENVGDTIWQTVVGISHCPFCGGSLPAAKQSIGCSEAEFQHFDSSGWDLKVL